MIVITVKKPNTLVIEISDEFKILRIRELTTFNCLPAKSQKTFLQPWIDRFTAARPYSQLTAINVLAKLGNIFQILGWTDLPQNENEWQTAVIDIFSLWISRAGRAKLTTKVNEWNAYVQPHFEYLRDFYDLIPISVSIPNGKHSASAEDLAEYRGKFIGDSDPIQVSSEITKLILPISLSRTDAAYLDEIRDHLAYRRKILDQCCIEWIEQIEAHFRYGQKVCKDIDWPALKDEIAKRKTRLYRSTENGDGLYHIANGDTEKSLGKLLTLIKNECGATISKKKLESIDGMPVLATINFPGSAPQPISSLVTKTDRLNWMIGNLSIPDLGFALTLLILRNPKFTESALTNSKILNKSGKRLITVDDIGISFEVIKWRAHAVKKSKLDDVSLRLIELILEMSEGCRKELIKKKSRLANLIFLSTDRGKVRSPSQASFFRFMTGRVSDKENWIGSYAPKIVAAGMGVGTLSFRKIRATEGVLEWFRTGSTWAMARKIGNSVQVSLNHYLPKPLLQAWNVRQLRRFQNLWIAVASTGEPYQLFTTDFSSLADLHSFLIDQLHTHPHGSSPLANELHSRTKDLLTVIDAEDTSSTKGKTGQLAVVASPSAFLSLYLYQESAIAAGIPASRSATKEDVSGISPRQIIAMAEIVRSRAQKDRNPQIRAAHEKALEWLPEAMRRTHWETLIAEWGSQHAN